MKKSVTIAVSRKKIGRSLKTINKRHIERYKNMGKNYSGLIEQILKEIGGKENIAQATHCMTRLRLTMKDMECVDMEKVKKIKGVMGCVNSGGQLQIIIGTTVADVYKEFCEMTGLGEKKEQNEKENKVSEEKTSAKGIVDRIFAYLSGSLTPLIPLLIAASLCKTVAAIFGPSLLGVMPENGDLYKLFTMMGDAGFYFLPVILAATAAKKLNCNMIIAMFIGAIMIHPTMIDMATKGTAFSVYGIPCSVQNYSSSVLPILLAVWAMSYVEKLINRFCPKVLKVVFVPFLTLLITIPIALCICGPIGNFIGNYICNGIIAVHNIAGPLAVALVGALFILLVSTGMHTVLIVFLFTTFPTMGYDAFILPGILSCSWAAAGVVLCCAFVKFKNAENKSEAFSYFMTWLLGGVGEPMIYGLLLRYRMALLASIIAGGISGLIVGLLNLTAYVCNPSNGIY